MSKPVGWRGESHRHSMAAKGIETGTKNEKNLSTPAYHHPVEKREPTPREAFQEIVDSVRQDVRTAIDDYMKDNPDEDRDQIEGSIDDNGAITEIYDGAVPVYTGDIMEIGSLPEVYNHVNDLGPAFDGESTPSNIIATSIYEILAEEANEQLHEYLDELENEGKFEGK